jgi:uncharacterized protein (DUF1330 family)
MQIRFPIILAIGAGIAIGAFTVEAIHAQAKPPAYAVVEIDVTNQEAYAKEYAPTAGKALTDGGGKYLARGGKTVTIDGDPPKSRTVVLLFENLEKAQAAFSSSAYRENRKIGDQYAKFRIWATEGLTQ